MTPRYLDTAVRAARAAGALLRGHFGQAATVNQATAHDIKLDLGLDIPKLREASAETRPATSSGSSIRSTGR